MKSKTLLLWTTACACPLAVQAVDVTLTASDALTDPEPYSFGGAGNWDNAAAPSAGNDYFTGGFLLRTPTSGTFAGDSLTVTGAGTFTGANNEAIMWKGSGTGGVITIDNLTVDGGQLRHGQGDTDSFTYSGNSLTVGANGMGLATQGGMTIASPINGDSQIVIIDSGSAGASRIITFSSDASTYNGNIVLNGSDNGRARLTFADDAVFNFLIGSAGTNNAISGVGTVNFNGDFALDLSGASSTPGDTWNLVTAGSATYGSTFTVAGFTDNGDDTWTSGDYVFDESTGSLTVIPEPSTALLGGLSLLALLRRRR
ncbi:hypothetical protein [Roseibacillus ishigakijimensis]|uniref:PEP-CTERM protein-sorting domain-containing protein n=1 Tax=Roseibacillus ishigakijimensis TaxID=454146 RepID=A0A934VKT3_9BACT|nr:hypothetical protein [Roseibacillus ishigakijimensis]MBK1832502.1 hypothetical protein [Roseibacillus ishigakijimensis]